VHIQRPGSHEKISFTDYSSYLINPITKVGTNKREVKRNNIINVKNAFSKGNK
jgi:hypothetical protein